MYIDKKYITIFSTDGVKIYTLGQDGEYKVIENTRIKSSRDVYFHKDRIIYGYGTLTSINLSNEFLWCVETAGGDILDLLVYKKFVYILTKFWLYKRDLDSGVIVTCKKSNTFLRLQRSGDKLYSSSEHFFCTMDLDLQIIDQRFFATNRVLRDVGYNRVVKINDIYYSVSNTLVESCTKEKDCHSVAVNFASIVHNDIITINKGVINSLIFGDIKVLPEFDKNPIIMGVMRYSNYYRLITDAFPEKYYDIEMFPKTLRNYRHFPKCIRKLIVFLKWFLGKISLPKDIVDVIILLSF